MQKEAYWAGIIIPLAILVLVGYMTSGDEPDYAMPVNTQIQDYAREHNISVIKPQGVLNSFSHGVMLGGAGGIASPQVDYINVTQFVEELKLNPNLDMIRYTEDGDTDSWSKIKRTYYVFSTKNQAGAVIRDTQWYDPAWAGKSNFRYTDSNLTAIIFHKQPWYWTYWWVILIIVLWLAAWLLHGP